MTTSSTSYKRIRSFFEVPRINEEGKHIKASVKLNSDHEIFKGHFPGNPVTPGVIQTEIVKLLLEDTLQTKLRLKKMAKCKFLKVLNPGENPEVEFSIQYEKDEEGLFKVSAGITNSDGETFYKFNGSFSAL